MPKGAATTNRKPSVQLEDTQESIPVADSGPVAGWRRWDWLWLLAYPIYQIIGTIRHEAAHALCAWAEGATIQEFVFWPSMANGRFYFGYVRWEGQVSPWATAAPYLLDVATFLLFFLLLTRIPIRRHWLWVNLVIIGLVSPLVNSGYQFLFASSGSDVYELARVWPPAALYAFFIFWLTVCVLGLLIVVRPRR